jgi:hypothetical protein
MGPLVETPLMLENLSFQNMDEFLIDSSQSLIIIARREREK